MKYDKDTLLALVVSELERLGDKHKTVKSVMAMAKNDPQLMVSLALHGEAIASALAEARHSVKH